MHIRWPRCAVRGGEYPDVSLIIDRDDRIVMGVAGLLVEQDCRAGNHTSLVIIIRDHVKQFLVTVRRCAAVAEEGLFDLIAIDGERLMLGAIRPQSAAVFIDVFIAGGLIHVPDAAIARIFDIKGQDGTCRRGIAVEEDAATEDTENQ